MWADKIPLTLEIKGGTSTALFTMLTITCQHSIDEFFNTETVKTS